MADIQAVDVWIGTTLGVLKGVALSTKQFTNFLPSSLSLSETSKSNEVCAMCWEHGSHQQLYLALRSGKVQCFNCEEQQFTAECDCTGGSGTIVEVGKHQDVLITCTDQGSLCFWPPREEKVECSVGNQVSCMATSPDSVLLVATGGRDNDLKLWDWSRPDSPVFQAKNVRNDRLDLKVPVWVTGIGFIPDSGTQPTIAVGTGYNQVRLYDTRAQRRPVYSKEYGEDPISALSVVSDGKSYLVGNTTGCLARIDLRSGGVVNQYKGFAGGVKSIQCSSQGSCDPLVAACGLDRYLRVYTMQPPKLLHQIYLKLECNCLLLSDSVDGKRSETEERSKVGQKQTGMETDLHEDDSSGDELWSGMERIGSKNKTGSKRACDPHCAPKPQSVTKRTKLVQ